MRNYILDNIGIKALAVVFAIFLWYFVGGQKRTEAAFLVSLDTAGLSREMIITGSTPRRVEVRLAGPVDLVKKLSPDRVRLEIDMSTVNEGVSKYIIETDNVKVPSRVKVLSVTPKTVEIRAERLLTAVLPVKVNFTGTPAKGFTAVSLTTDPPEVEVTGRQKRIKSISKVYTGLIDIEGFNKTRTYPVRIDVPDKLGGVEPEKVDVTVTIIEQTVDKGQKNGDAKGVGE